MTNKSDLENELDQLQDNLVKEINAVFEESERRTRRADIIFGIGVTLSVVGSLAGSHAFVQGYHPFLAAGIIFWGPPLGTYVSYRVVDYLDMRDDERRNKNEI